MRGQTTQGDTIKAIDSMQRMSGSEGPPDDKGHRQIWHHSDAGGELVTLVDRTGRVLRQELTLFDDFIQWQAGARLRTGKMAPRKESRAPLTSEATFDTAPKRDRIERVREAFEGSAPLDPYLQNIKRLVESSQSSGFPAAAVVTRAVSELYGRRSKSDSGASSKKWVAVAIAGVGLLLFVLSRLNH